MADLIGADTIQRGERVGMVLTWEVEGREARAKAESRSATLLRFPTVSRRINIIEIRRKQTVESFIPVVDRYVWHVDVFVPMTGEPSPGLDLP
jgi:hypothetical protein